ncbi:MAG TPA: hypothetical protein VN681_13285 [Stellaceae bacterium]|nr:hypothetical protein [Stellaceae bacterium]
MTIPRCSGKRMAKLESAIVDLLLRDTQAAGAGAFEHLSVLTVLLAKMLCACADADSGADEGALLDMQTDALRDAVRLIRGRELWRAKHSPSARTH